MTPNPLLGQPFPPYRSFVQPTPAFGCGGIGATLEVVGKIEAGTDPVPAPCYGTSTFRDIYVPPPDPPVGSGHDWTPDVAAAQTLVDTAQDNYDAARRDLATALDLNNWSSIIGDANTINAAYLVTYGLKCQWTAIVWKLPDAPNRKQWLAIATSIDPHGISGTFYAGVQNFLNALDGHNQLLCNFKYSAPGGFQDGIATLPSLLPSPSTPAQASFITSVTASFDTFVLAVQSKSSDWAALESTIAGGTHVPSFPAYTDPANAWTTLITKWKLLDVAQTHLAVIGWRRDNDDGRGGIIYENGFTVGGASPSITQKARVWKTWPETSSFNGVLNYSIYNGSVYTDQHPVAVNVVASDGTPTDAVETSFAGDGQLAGVLAVNVIKFTFSNRIAQISMVKGELFQFNFPAWTGIPSDGCRWFQTVTVTATSGTDYTGSLSRNDMTGLLPNDMSAKAVAFLANSFPSMPPNAVTATLTATSASWILSPTLTITFELSNEVTLAAISARCDEWLDLSNPDTMGAGNVFTPWGVAEYGTWVSSDGTCVRKAVSVWTADSVFSSSATWDKFNVTPTGLARSTATLTGASPDTSTFAPETYYAILANGTSLETARATSLGGDDLNWPCD